MADKIIVEEWLERADQDFKFASFSLKQTKDEFFSLICFHFHQAAEKYLKAYIVAYDLEFRKIHNLQTLLEICEKRSRSFKEIKQECAFLKDFYVDTRYPTWWPTVYSKESVFKAQKAAKKIGDFIKEKVS